MPLPKEELYTIGDIYSLPEGERAELIDGQIYDMAPPSRHHQEISMELSTAIQSYIRSKKRKLQSLCRSFCRAAGRGLPYLCGA